VKSSFCSAALNVLHRRQISQPAFASFAASGNDGIPDAKVAHIIADPGYTRYPCSHVRYGGQDPPRRRDNGLTGHAQAARYEKIWRGWRSLLQQFVDEKGTLPVLTEQYQGRNLGRWCDTQRVAKRNGTLLWHRAESLESIRGCEFVWDKDFEKVWCRWLALLQQYVDENKRLPKTDEPYQGRNLGYWCHTQRLAKRNGTLLPHRAERLEGIRGCEFVWDYTTLSWAESFSLVKEFAAKEGRPPRFGEVYGGRELYEWGLVHRHSYRGGMLSVGKMDLLTTVEGWHWTIRDRFSKEKQRKWDAWCDLLLTFSSLHKKIPRQKEIFQGEKLGSWCNRQQNNYKYGRIVEFRRRQLESVPE
jgi:Helicase associated domain